MLRFAANLTRLFTEVEFLDRFAAAARVGFKGVEFNLPYAWSRDAIAEKLSEFELTPLLYSLPCGDWGAGERGIACHPDRIGEFENGVTRALTYAKAIGCKQLHCYAGITPPGVSAEPVRDTLIRNLRFAADALQADGVKLLIEPKNRFDMPGYVLQRVADAFDVMDATSSDNIFLVFDTYHMQRTEGELAGTLQRHLSRIAHLHLADNPGRHEPGTGEINFPYLFRHLERIGYTGWIGCEYTPARGTIDGLGWIQPWR